MRGLLKVGPARGFHAKVSGWLGEAPGSWGRAGGTRCRGARDEWSAGRSSGRRGRRLGPTGTFTTCRRVRDRRLGVGAGCARAQPPRPGTLTLPLPSSSHSEPSSGKWRWEEMLPQALRRRCRTQGRNINPAERRLFSKCNSIGAGLFYLHVDWRVGFGARGGSR